MNKDFPRALKNVSGDLFVPDAELVQKGLEYSRQSPRKRIILPLHRTQDARVQRMLNFMQPGTYIRPHRHNQPHAIETILVQQGAIYYLTFNNDGDVTRNLHISSSGLLPALVDIEPGVWHSFLVLKHDTILFEVKNGPYDAKTDKEFADWAPEEFTKESQEWMDNLKRAVQSDDN